MHVILSAILLALAILDLVIGTGFLIDPGSSGADFGLAIVSMHGESTLRGDMTAFFYVTALSLAWGGWKRRGDVLLPALGLPRSLDVPHLTMTRYLSSFPASLWIP